MSLALDLISSSRDGAMGWIEKDGQPTVPGDPDSRRVFFPETNGSLSWATLAAFRTDGAKVRTFGSIYRVEDVIIG